MTAQESEKIELEDTLNFVKSQTQLFCEHEVINSWGEIQTLDYPQPIDVRHQENIEKALAIALVAKLMKDALEAMIDEYQASKEVLPAYYQAKDAIKKYKETADDKR